MAERDRLRASLVRRETSHQRAILLALAALLVLSMSPLFGHHLPLGFSETLAGRDHFWALCVVALHAILAPVHDAFHLLFFGGLAFATWDRIRAWRSVGRVLSSVAAAPPRAGDAIWRAARAAGLDPARVLVVYGLPTPAFTTGLLRPRIYAAAALPDRLTDDELAAVLAHEAAHVRRRDPLRLSVLRFLGCALFWMPALRRVTADFAAEAEVRADDAAAERHALALASALLRLADWNASPRRAVGVGFTGADLLERRVLRLAGEAVAPRSRITRRSLVGASAALLLAWTSGLAVAHPLPSGHDSHCDGHGFAAVFHLFCSSVRANDAADLCPFRHAGH